MNKEREESSFFQYAHSFQAVTKPGLSRVCKMLDLLGNPEKELSCIHVAGTNGKGSVCAFLDAILTRAGYRVGRYTSPNLLRVNERMTVNGICIDNSALTVLLTSVEAVCRQAEEALGERPTQFEVWTAAAFLYFAKEKCDYVILETGMGGEFDATNAISENVTAVLTRVDLDHTEYLGDTIPKITKTKCGIFKENCRLHRVFSAEQTSCALAVANECAAKLGLSLTVVSPLPSVGASSLSEICLYRGKKVVLGLNGPHQTENASLAVAVAEAMGVPYSCIAEGLSSAVHPARLEILRPSPLLLYDGAHNPNGAQSLDRALTRYLQNERLTFIVACMRDKDISETLSCFSRHASRFIFTTVLNNPRADMPDTLQARAKKIGIFGETAPDLQTALSMLREDEKALVCGSLYLYADLPSNLRSL